MSNFVINFGWHEFVMLAALLSVAAILGWGLLTMARGGEYNKNKSNLIMRYRIIFQAIAILIFCILLWLKRDGGA
ncbi:MAG: twin transmembrane helix small protein [Candidatus Puniceispirillaceae bacterium]